MKIVARILLVVSCYSCLSACSTLGGDHGYFHDRSRDYRFAQEHQGMKHTTAKNADRHSDIFHIPSLPKEINPSHVSRKPPGIDI